MFATFCHCGYRLVRAGPVFGANTLIIEPFAESGPAGMTGDVTAFLHERLAAGGVALTNTLQEAQLVLSGRLSLAMFPGATLSSVQVYNVDAIVVAQLHDRSGQLLWRHDNTVRESFLPPDPGTFPEPLTIETRRRVALNRLADRAAQSVVEALELASVWHEDEQTRKQRLLQQEAQPGARATPLLRGD